MAGTFKFELVTPERKLIPRPGDDPKSVAIAEATEAIVPGMDGQFTVLAGHAPAISALRPGVIDIKLTSGRRRIFVRGGIVEVEPDQLVILAQQVIDLDDAEPGLLAKELATAKEMLAAAGDDTARMVAQDAIDQLTAAGAA
ncbi:MAG: ATP synthase F1 subunit epsilon [Hyphomicrobiaceae bacterium]